MKNNRLLKKSIAVLVLFLIMINLICASAVNIPESLNIKVVKKDIGYEVEYDTFYIIARKIYSDEYNSTIYCLDIDKDYPAGNKFKLDGSVSKNIEHIINAGYPNRSASELNLSNDDEAYYATQIAIWCDIEGYDVNKIKGDKKLVNAIKNIFNEGESNMRSPTVTIKEYTSENKSIQRAAVIFKYSNDSSINEAVPEKSNNTQKPEIPSEGLDIDLTEDEAENIQSPYPPQEG